MKTKLLIFLLAFVYFLGLNTISNFIDYLNSMEEMALLMAIENEDFQENEESSKEIKDAFDENSDIHAEHRFVFIFFSLGKNYGFHHSFSISGFVPGLISPPPEA